MNTQELQMQTDRPELGEVKKQVLYRDVDDSMSEWERARQTSKTWSMEQD